MTARLKGSSTTGFCPMRSTHVSTSLHGRGVASESDADGATKASVGLPDPVLGANKGLLGTDYETTVLGVGVFAGDGV